MDGETHRRNARPAGRMGGHDADRSLLSTRLPFRRGTDVHHRGRPVRGQYELRMAPRAIVSGREKAWLALATAQVEPDAAGVADVPGGRPPDRVPAAGAGSLWAGRGNRSARDRRSAVGILSGEFRCGLSVLASAR